MERRVHGDRSLNSQRIFFLSLLKNCNHKGLGIYYLLSAFIFGISGTLISVLIRIELYSSGNRIISPERQGNAFISLEISSQFFIFFSLFSFILAWTFISLQIKEFRIMSLSINDSVYSCLFFFLTGLRFFHLLVGLLLLSLLFWGCSFHNKIIIYISLR